MGEVLLGSHQAEYPDSWAFKSSLITPPLKFTLNISHWFV